MKTTDSNYAPITSEDKLRALTTEALSLEKAAQAKQAKARLAKRRYKTARKAFKQAKKDAKKATKLARRAQRELEACVDNVAMEKKAQAAKSQRDAAKAEPAPARPSRRKAPLRKTTPPLPAASTEAIVQEQPSATQQFTPSDSADLNNGSVI